MAASWSKLSKALEDVSSALSISLIEADVSETALSKASRSQRSRSTSVSPKAFGAVGNIKMRKASYRYIDSNFHSISFYDINRFESIIKNTLTLNIRNVIPAGFLPKGFRIKIHWITDHLH